METNVLEIPNGKEIVTLVIDIHRNILAANFTIGVTGNSFRKITVKCEANSLIISLSSDCVTYPKIKLSTPPNFFEFPVISPGSGNSIQLVENQCKQTMEYEINKDNRLEEENKKLIFRLRVSSYELLKEIIKEPSNDEHNTKTNRKISSGIFYNIYCMNCKANLTSNPIGFKNIKKYEDKSADLSESWFCHVKCEMPNVETIDFYIDDICYYWHSSVCDILQTTDGDMRKCGKCNALLTSKRKLNSKFLSFFRDKVFLTNEIEPNFELYQQKDMVYDCLSSLLLKALQSSAVCKLYLKSQVEEREISLLLWVTHEKIYQFLMCCPVANVPSSQDLKTDEVYKVLFLSTNQTSDIAKVWRHDFAVDFHEISDSMMKMIVSQLEESSILAPSTPMGNEFKIGYLPACV